LNQVQRLAAIVAELRARKVAEAALPLATAELKAAGFKVYPFGEGLAVDEARGLSAKLDELSARGIHPPMVCIIRSLDDEIEEHASGTAETAKASEGWSRGGGAAPGSRTPTVPATPDRKRRSARGGASKRVTDPPTRRRNDV
jgi:hypothetical protein